MDSEKFLSLEGKTDHCFAGHNFFAALLRRQRTGQISFVEPLMSGIGKGEDLIIFVLRVP